MKKLLLALVLCILFVGPVYAINSEDTDIPDRPGASSRVGIEPANEEISPIDDMIEPYADEIAPVARETSEEPANDYTWLIVGVVTGFVLAVGTITLVKKYKK